MALFFKKKTDKDGDKDLLIAQAERIEDLKRENASLRLDNERLRAREQEVIGVLAMARELAKEYEKEGKIRFALECERLEVFREKWQGYIKDLESATNLGEKIIETEKKLRECEREIRKAITENLPYECPSSKDYFSEQERLKEALPLSLAEKGIESLSDTDLKQLIAQLLDKD